MKHHSIPSIKSDNKKEIKRKNIKELKNISGGSSEVLWPKKGVKL